MAVVERGPSAYCPVPAPGLTHFHLACAREPPSQQACVAWLRCVLARLLHTLLTSLHCTLCVCWGGVAVVLEGMDVVMKVEAIGSGSGTPSKKVVIVDSGELKETS